MGIGFAVGFSFGVGWVVCTSPFSEGLLGLVSGRLGILGYAAIERKFREPLDIDATLGSDRGGCTQFDTDVHEGQTLVLEDW